MANVANVLSIPRALRLFQRKRIDAFCLSSDSVGRFVYISGDRVGKTYTVCTVDPLVRAKMPAIGLIIQKYTTTKCVVQLFGEVRGIFTGLTPGHYVFIGLSGELVSAPVDPPVGRFLFHQMAGIAFASDVVFLYLDSTTMAKRVG